MSKRLPWVLCILLLSCNMGRHYALKRLGHPVSISNDEVYTQPETTTTTLPATSPFAPVPNNAAASVATKTNCDPITKALVTHRPDTLLSSKTKHKPRGSRVHYTNDKKAIQERKDQHKARWIGLLFGVLIFAGLTLLVGAAVDGSLFSIFVFVIAAVFAAVALWLLVLLVLTLIRGA